jgi:hypothetical protein
MAEFQRSLSEFRKIRPGGQKFLANYIALVLSSRLPFSRHATVSRDARRKFRHLGAAASAFGGAKKRVASTNSNTTDAR